MLFKNNDKVLFFTVDVEEYYHAQLISNSGLADKSKQTPLDKYTEKLLELCALHDIKGTFFVLGEIAKHKPEIVKKIFAAGHEIASHSFAHGLVYNMTPSQFKKDLHHSCEVLENITGDKVVGFRAPSWSANLNILDWFYDILIEEGMKYSSSIFPGKTFLYGAPESEDFNHYPIVNGKNKEIIEIPQSVFRLGKISLGFTGGFYFRFWPLFVIKYLIDAKLKKRESLFLYVHPYEIDSKLEYLKIGMFENFIQYYNLKNTLNKLDNIFSKYKNGFCTMREFVSANSNNFDSLNYHNS